MKEKILKLVCILFVTYLFFCNTQAVYGNQWLPAPIVKGLIMTKNVNDPNQSDDFFKDSYPFTISFTFDDATLNEFSYDTVALLESCSFYPLANVGEYSAFYDYNNKTFTFYNMLYTGDDREFTVTIADKGFVQTISFNIGLVVPESDIESSSSEESSSTIPSSGASTSSKSSSSRESSSKESSSKSSSSKASSSKSSSSKSTSSKVPDLPASLTPQLIVSSYSYAENITSDIPFVTTIEITNTSESIAAEGIVVTFDQSKSNNSIEIIDGTNIRYIQFIAPGEKQTVEITCISKTISDKSYENLAMTISFEYYDVDGDDPLKGKNESILSFYTEENHTIRIERIQLPDDVYINEIFDLSYRLVNLGLSTAKNVDISILSEKDGELSRTFVGKIDPSTAITEPTIPMQLTKLGQHDLFFVVYYSENGEIKSVQSKFTVFVSDPPPEEDSSEEESSEEPEEEVSKKPAVIIEKSENNLDDSLVLGIFVTIIVIIIAYIIYLIAKYFLSNKKVILTDKSNKISDTILKDLQEQNSKKK